jgi:methylenetetrahydrofolate reductase (NADPH)
VARDAAAAVHVQTEEGLAAALAHARYEVLPLDGIVDEVVAHVPRAVTVTVTASAANGLEPTLAVAEQLAAHGYEVVPHLSARLVRDKGHLETVLQRLHTAQVRDVFVIAGDAREPAGKFHGAAELLSAMGALTGEMFAEVGITGYSESHHLISDEMTIDAMFEKEPMATYHTREPARAPRPDLRRSGRPDRRCPRVHVQRAGPHGALATAARGAIHPTPGVRRRLSCHR